MKAKKGVRTFYGVGAHVISAIAGFALSAYSIYWLGRSDQVLQIIDIVIEHDSVPLTFYNRRGGDLVKISMEHIIP